MEWIWVWLGVLSVTAFAIGYLVAVMRLPKTLSKLDQEELAILAGKVAEKREESK